MSAVVDVATDEDDEDAPPSAAATTTVHHNNNNTTPAEDTLVDTDDDDDDTDKNEPTTTTTTAAAEQEEQEQQVVVQLPSDFTLLTSVAWGPRRGEDGYDTDQTLAPRPKRKSQHDSDACHCPIPTTGMGCIDESCVLYACREE